MTGGAGNGFEEGWGVQLGVAVCRHVGRRGRWRTEITGIECSELLCFYMRTIVQVLVTEGNSSVAIEGILDIDADCANHVDCTESINGQ